MRRGNIIGFVATDEGSAAVEYSLVVAAIALGLLAVFIPYGTELRQIALTILSGVSQIVSFSSL